VEALLHPPRSGLTRSRLVTHCRRLPSSSVWRSPRLPQQIILQTRIKLLSDKFWRYHR